MWRRDLCAFGPAGSSPYHEGLLRASVEWEQIINNLIDKSNSKIVEGMKYEEDKEETSKWMAVEEEVEGQNKEVEQE